MQQCVSFWSDQLCDFVLQNNEVGHDSLCLGAVPTEGRHVRIPKVPSAALCSSSLMQCLRNIGCALNNVLIPAVQPTGPLP